MFGFTNPFALSMHHLSAIHNQTQQQSQHRVPGNSQGASSHRGLGNASQQRPAAHELFQQASNQQGGILNPLLHHHGPATPFGHHTQQHHSAENESAQRQEVTSGSMMPAAARTGQQQHTLKNVGFDSSTSSTGFANTPSGLSTMSSGVGSTGGATPGSEGRMVVVSGDNMVAMANLSYGGDQFYGKHKVGPEDFILLKVIGKGSYGKVMMVKYKLDSSIYAMKMLRKENIIKRNQVEHTKTERNVLETMSHPFIVQLYFAFQTPKKLYFVMEYCPGGELFYHLSRAGRFSESKARFYAAEIILALEHLHRLDIVYRDLKPENVLLDAKGHVRLTDFGLSKEGVQDNFSAKSLCGTPEYLAPEILNQTGHGKAVDWWSLGALIYEMLTGLPPFYTRDRERLFENICCGELRYPSFLTRNAKSLLVGLFQRNPNMRLGGGPKDAGEIKSHPFFESVDWERMLEKKEIPPFRPTLVSQTDTQNFDKEFVKLPVNNSEVPDSALAQASRDEMFAGFSYDRSKESAFNQF